MPTKKGRPKKTLQPIMPQKVPPAPKSLGDAAKAIWDVAARDLCERGIFAVADTPQLETFCRMHVIFQTSMARVEKDGPTIDSPHGIKRHPAWGMAKEAAQVCAQMAGQLGLSAAARKRIGAASGAVDGDDPILDRSV